MRLNLGIILCILVVAGLGLGYRDTLATDRHLGSEVCSDCHLAKTNLIGKNAKKLKAGQEYLCSGCHENAIKASHPSGFNVGRKLPKAFPTDWKGDLTCSTCHDVHGNQQGLMRVEERGAALCTQCHDTAFFQAMRDGAESIMQSGHVGVSLPVDGGLDVFSMNCMECHLNQVSAPKIAISGQVIRHTSSSVNHPIGGNYDEATRYGGYRPSVMLDKNIMLPNGALSCVSCHIGYSKTHGEMVMPAGDICYECHDL